MKLSLAAAAAIAQLASAHYYFEVFVADGQESKPLEFIRENTRPAKYNPTKWKNVSNVSVRSAFGALLTSYLND
jgi:hypothetical protein